MVSNSDPRDRRGRDEQPGALAFRELEHLVHMLGEEIAGWRRRAQIAESRVRELESAAARVASPASADPAVGEQGDRVAALEREKAEVEARLDAARERTEQLLERVRFLRQQHDLGPVG